MRATAAEWHRTSLAVLGESVVVRPWCTARALCHDRPSGDVADQFGRRRRSKSWRFLPKPYGGQASIAVSAGRKAVMPPCSVFRRLPAPGGRSAFLADGIPGGNLMKRSRPRVKTVLTFPSGEA